MSVLDDKPVFTVDVEGFNVSYFVRVNGIAVYREYSHSSQISLSVPVNHYMHPEENILSVDVVPPKKGAPFKPNSRVVATLNVHNSGHSGSQVAIANIVFDGNASSESEAVMSSSSSGRFDILSDLEERPEGDVRVDDITATSASDYEGAVLYERKITAPNSLPLWAFFNSDDLPEYFEIPDEEYYPELESLMKEYQKVQSALETGEVDSVIPLFDERNREVDMAFYREPGTTEQGILESLKESANDKNLELVELSKDFVHLLPEENRKLVRLVAADDGAAIGLNFIEGQGSVRYDLVFRRENGKWILTR